MDVQFKVPSNFYISGQSQCGKSYLVRRLLYYLNDLFHPVPSKVIYCYGEYQKEFDELHGVEFIEGFPEDLNALVVIILLCLRQVPRQAWTPRIGEWSRDLAFIVFCGIRLEEHV